MIVNTHERLQYKFIIISTDKDFYQLVQEDVKIYNPTKKFLVTLDTFTEKINKTHKTTFKKITPEEYIIFRYLVGDSSDNIPGIYGIGPKRSQKILEEHEGKFDSIFNNLKEEDKPIFSRNLKLMNLRYMYINICDEKLWQVVNKRKPLDTLTFRNKIKDIFGMLDFDSFLEDFDNFIFPFLIYDRNSSLLKI